MDTLRVKMLFRAFVVLVLTVPIGVGSVVMATPEQGTYQVVEISQSSSEKGFLLNIKGNMPPTFTVYQLFDPLRVVVDIADASFDKSVKLPIEINQKPVATIIGKMLTEKEPVIAKVEIILNADVGYEAIRSGNDIEVVFEAAKAEAVGNVSNESSFVDEEKAMSSGIELANIDVTNKNGAINILLVAGQSLTEYVQAELPADERRPARMYLDIKGASGRDLEKVIEIDRGGLARIRSAAREDGVRIVFDSSSDQLFTYSLSTDPQGLLLIITEPQEIVAAIPKEVETDPVSKLLASMPAQEDGSENKPITYDQAEKETVKTQFEKVGIVIHEDEFSASGYNKQRISVDFYKTSLHNVFRLISEISGYNVVVDESVSGSLTLSLQEVPWDFILDVVLNLKELQKEERFNTLVISPKAKGFTWPERVTASAEDEDLEAPTEKQELVIDEQMSQPPEVITAKMIMQEGNNLSKAGRNKEALAKYEKSLDTWPKNADLAKKIAILCLTKLGYYQKAADYAEKALALEPEDQEAALQAAISYANMRNARAKQYFEKATQGDRPARAALLSYAAYLEESLAYKESIVVLNRYETLYSHTLDAMTAKARLYDKMAMPTEAAAEYRGIINSGYEIEDDFRRYINTRIAQEKR